jgi:hypothetical protein
LRMCVFVLGNPQQPGLYFLAADEIFRLKRERGYDDMHIHTHTYINVLIHLPIFF